MTAKECITGRRSIRHFTEQPVAHEVLEGIVHTASFVPSWKHTQVTRYIAIEGDLKGEIAKCTSAYPPNGIIIDNAPMLIAVTVVKGRSGFERDGSYSTQRGDSWQMFDAGIASEAFCLSAYEQGLGTVIIGIFDQEEITSLLELSDDRELVALIALGHPAEVPNTLKRKTVSELLTYK